MAAWICCSAITESIVVVSLMPFCCICHTVMNSHSRCIVGLRLLTHERCNGITAVVRELNPTVGPHLFSAVILCQDVKGSSTSVCSLTSSKIYPSFNHHRQFSAAFLCNRMVISPRSTFDVVCPCLCISSWSVFMLFRGAN